MIEVRVIEETSVRDLHEAVAWLCLENHIRIDGEGCWFDLVEGVDGVGAVGLIRHVLDLDAADALDVLRRIREWRP